ncbi:MAG: MFS transporter [Chloroflexi bacterium]|nr:MFS transporter [Chloroflexota bacterium]
MTATSAVAGRGPASTGEFQNQTVGLTRGLQAFRHRDFSLFWISQLVSLVGTWMQVLGQIWLVLELGGSPFDLGLVSALQFLPMLGLSMFGGFLADHLPKRYLLIGSQSTAAMLAFALALLAWTGIVNIFHVMILAVLLGLVNSVDMPTRQAYVVELVGRRDLPNAIALNSAAFNAARLVGPAVAGLLIGWLGLAPVFLLNGLSFLPVVVALLAMKAGSTSVATGTTEPGAVLENMREGFAYVHRSRPVFLTVALVAVVSTIGMNFSVIAPLFARNILNVGAEGLGLLISAMGLGSLLASGLLAFLPWEPHPKLLLGGAAVFASLEMALGLARQFNMAAILMGAIGFAMIIFTTVANTTLQTSTPDHLRGRVMSVYATVFVGSTPIGSLVTGYLAQTMGIALTVIVEGAIGVAAALVAWLKSARE